MSGMWTAAALLAAQSLCLAEAEASNSTLLTTTTQFLSAEQMQWQECQVDIRNTMIKYGMLVNTSRVDKVCSAMSMVRQRKEASAPSKRFLADSSFPAASTWTDIGDKLSDLDWDSITWGKEDPITKEKQNAGAYGTALAGTIYTVGAIEAGIDGDWGTFWQGLGQTAAQFSTFIPAAGPFISVALSFFLSFFGGDDIGTQIQEALEKMYKQIMKEVKGLLSQEEVANAVKDAQIKTAACADRVADAPRDLPLPDPRMDEGDYLTYKLGWWDVTEKGFDDSWRNVFGAMIGCLDSPGGSKPATTKSKECKEFQEKGAVFFQFNFVLMHISVLVEQARLAPLQRYTRLYDVQEAAAKYYPLLKDSFDTWQAAYSFSCEYSFDKCWSFRGSCAPCPIYRPPGSFCKIDDCCTFNPFQAKVSSNPLQQPEYKRVEGTATLKNTIQPKHYSGLDITCEMSCDSSAKGSGKLDPCTTPLSGACSNSDFATFNEKYRQLNKNHFQPLLNALKTLSGPLRMQETVDSIMARGRLGVQNDVDSGVTKVLEDRKKALYDACRKEFDCAGLFEDWCMETYCSDVKNADPAKLPDNRCACRAQYCDPKDIWNYDSCKNVCNILPGTFD